MRAIDFIVEGLGVVRSEWDRMGIDNYISERGGIITLSSIIVGKGERGKGLGSKAMGILCTYADRSGQIIVLSPSKDFGGSSVGRLVDFYKGFGFVLNKGRNKDYRFSEMMYREPR